MVKDVNRDLSSYYNESFDKENAVKSFFEKIDTLFKKTSASKVYEVFQVITENTRLFTHYQHLSEEQKNKIITSLFEKTEGKCISHTFDRSLKALIIKEALIYAPEIYDKYKPEFFKGDLGYLYLMEFVFVEEIRGFLNDCIKDESQSSLIKEAFKNRLEKSRSKAFELHEVQMFGRLFDLFKYNNIDIQQEMKLTNRGGYIHFLSNVLLPYGEFFDFLTEDGLEAKEIKENFNYFLKEANEKNIYLPQILENKKFSDFINMNDVFKKMLFDIPFGDKNNIAEMLINKLNNIPPLLQSVHKNHETYKKIVLMQVEKEKYDISKVIKQEPSPVKNKKRI